MSGEEKMPDMRYAAGMDGGGTKTVLEARAPDGRVLWEFLPVKNRIRKRV